MEEIVTGDKYNGKRADKCMAEILRNMGINVPSRSFLKNAFNSGILVNGSTMKRSHKLKKGDVIKIDREYFNRTLKEIDLSENIIPQEGKLDIVYENDNYIVLNKQKGVAVHPGVRNRDNTISNYVRWYLEDKKEYDPLVDRAGIVHRLDKGVSGLMVVAKNKKMQDFLKTQFKKHKVGKIYMAEVEKFRESKLDMLDIYNDFVLDNNLIIDSRWLTVEGYIGRNHINRFKMEFKPYEFAGSKSAVSHFLRVEEEKYLIKIDTGRMHQIRATFEYLGRYICGDTLYKPGSRVTVSDKISLESIYLSFVDISGEKKFFSILE